MPLSTRSTVGPLHWNAAPSAHDIVIGPVAGAADTPNVCVAEVVALPTRSVARAVMLCVPTVAPLQVKSYRSLVPARRVPSPIFVEPRKNSTSAMPSLSLAVAVSSGKGSARLAVELIATVGGRLAAMVTVRDGETVVVPRLSVARAVIV